jgi:hypothetical protein
LAQLTRDREQTILSLRDSLKSALTRRAALSVLAMLDTSFTLALTTEVVTASLSHRDALLAREVLARAAFAEYAQTVPPYVDQLLQDGDDDTFRRLAELLDHLGLYRDLKRLCDRAAVSDDPHVREVGADFTHR